MRPVKTGTVVSGRWAEDGRVSWLRWIWNSLSRHPRGSFKGRVWLFLSHLIIKKCLFLTTFLSQIFLLSRPQPLLLICSQKVIFQLLFTWTHFNLTIFGWNLLIFNILLEILKLDRI